MQAGEAETWGGPPVTLSEVWLCTPGSSPWQAGIGGPGREGVGSGAQLSQGHRKGYRLDELGPASEAIEAGSDLKGKGELSGRLWAAGWPGPRGRHSLRPCCGGAPPWLSWVASGPGRRSG